MSGNRKAPSGYPSGALVNCRVMGDSATALAFLVGAAAAATPTELQVAIEFEPIHVEVHFDGLGALKKIPVDDILIAVNFKLLIRLVRLIQSHGQAGTASAAFIEKNSNGAYIPTFEIRRDLFTGRRCYFEHVILLEKIQLRLIRALSNAADAWLAVISFLSTSSRPVIFAIKLTTSSLFVNSTQRGLIDQIKAVT